MAQQLVFTSTPQGLEPGRSGYCTVARHKDLRHRLVRELERLSVYDFGQQTASQHSDICIYRKIPLGSEEYYVLTKICDAGLDYTNRTNYLAHHLVLDGFEIATCPSPAEIFLNWDGWLRTWEDGPRYFGEEEVVTLSSYKSSNLIPCQGWLQMTNDPGNAASLVSPDMVKPIVIEGKPENSNTLLTLFAESSALLKISLDAWDFSFTTFLQGNDDTKTFSWIGITGQPAGEKLKQGGIRNYLDLRKWSASAISDPIDPGFEHLARKGPEQIPAKKKSATVTKSPFSEQELQRAKASAPVAASGAPSGSTVFPQQSAGGGTSKSKKKRPWLLQLAVISTALCLLVSLIVGLTMNWENWFHDEVAGKTPDPVTPPDPPAPVSPPKETVRTVALDSPVQLDRVEYVRLAEKDRWMEWIDLNVGASKPVRVNLSKDLRELMGDDIEKMEKGEELQVVIDRDDEENLVFKSVQKAPDPENRGISRSIELNEKESVSLSEDEQTMFFKSGDKTYPLALSLLSSSDRRRMLEVYDSIQSGESIRFNPRVKDGRIVYFEPVVLSSDPPDEPDSNELPKGKPMTLTAVRGGEAIRLEEEQKRIFIRVRGTTTLPYVFKESERDRIMRLVRFLNANEQEVDLNLREDGDRITSLEFELPPSPEVLDPSTGPVALDPNKLMPETTIVFWLPGKLITDRWTIEPKKRYVFEHADLPDLVSEILDEGMEGGAQPQAWMADFEPRLLMERGTVGGFDFEPYTYERDRDRLDPLKITNFHLKQNVNGKDFYSFTFKLTKKESIQVNAETPETENFIRKGKLVRFPKRGPGGGCLDMFFLSNLHGNLTDEQKLGEFFTRDHLGNLAFSPPWLRDGKTFQFLSPKSSAHSYHLTLSVHSSVGPEKITSMVDKDLKTMGWKNFKDTELPEAFLQVSSQTPFRGKIIADQEYASNAQNNVLLKKNEQDETVAKQEKAWGERKVWKPIVQYRDYAEKKGYEFRTQSLGHAIYDSTFEVLRKVLEGVHYNLLVTKCPPEVYKTDRLCHDVKLAKAFWEQVSKAVKDQIDGSIALPRHYEDAIARRDIERLFTFLEHMVRIEAAFGFTDGEGLLMALVENRNALSLSTDEKSTYRRLLAQVLKNSREVGTLLSDSMDNYRKLQDDLVRHGQLTSSQLAHCSRLLSWGVFSEPKKKESFEKYNNSNEPAGGDLSNLLERLNSRVLAPKLQMSQRDAFINKVPWTLSILQKTSSGDYVKESDFLRLAPPQIQ